MNNLGIVTNNLESLENNNLVVKPGNNTNGNAGKIQFKNSNDQVSLEIENNLTSTFQGNIG